MTTNEELMRQCREDAREAYRRLDLTQVPFLPFEWRHGYAQALYDERSKFNPLDHGHLMEPRLTVDEALSVFMQFVQDMRIKIPLYHEVVGSYRKRLSKAAKP